MGHLEILKQLPTLNLRLFPLVVVCERLRRL